VEGGISMDQIGSQGGPGRKSYLSHAIKKVDREVLSSKQMNIQGALRASKAHSKVSK
jgi:hypothetical protein